MPNHQAITLATARAGRLILRGIAAALFLQLAIVNSVALAKGPDNSGTHWIWDESARAKGSTGLLQKRFIADHDVATATVRVHTDFCEATLTLNGHRVHHVTPLDAFTVTDVRRLLRSGENVLLIRAVATGGPAAIAAELTLTSVVGSTRVVRSDGTWESAGEPKPSFASTLSRTDVEPWWKVSDRPSTSAFDEYNQWEEARGSGKRADVSKFQLPSGFQIELLREAQDGEGSWISLTLDPQGRLIIGREDKGLMRLTLPNESQGESTMERINDTLRGCHGILWAHGSIYANASDSKALYRLRDSNGDDQFDEARLLRQIPGDTGDHGRNDLVLGPHGNIYLIHGDVVLLPNGFESRVPMTREFAKSGQPPGGHIIRTDPDGRIWEVIASGLRNPYGVDINVDGELFTFDADSESHVGLPWYRATRMNHLVSGADYGWRADMPWPTYQVDSLPPNIPIGRSSPTGVRFAYRSDFPPHYRNALFALDWAYGRIFSVQVIPRGASYSMHPEIFLRGRPFNVVDLDFASDGSMYLITGGYQTRSALYRVKYDGSPVAKRERTTHEIAREAYSHKLRALRRKLESLHRADAEDAVITAWPYLHHPDRWIRHAARVAIEHQPVAKWEEKVWEETHPDRALSALLALGRVAPSSMDAAIRTRLAEIPLDELSTESKLTAVRILELTDYNHTKHGAAYSRQVIDKFERLYPNGERALDRELCRLLVRHGSRQVAKKTLDVLATEPIQKDRLLYLSALSEVSDGWTHETRSAFFRLLSGARHSFGDEGMPDYIRRLEDAAISNLPEDERAQYEPLLATNPLDESHAISRPDRPFVKKWSLSDFQADLTGNDYKADFKRGASLYRDVLCIHCHRLGAVGRAVGPDLTAVGARFRRREILESVLTPSKSISSRFQNHVVLTSDGRTVTGQLVWNGFRKSIIRIATDPMRLDQVTEISKGDISAYQLSPVSSMPEGLLDTLTRDEILDLIAYLESGGA